MVLFPVSAGRIRVDSFQLRDTCVSLPDPASMKFLTIVAGMAMDSREYVGSDGSIVL